MAHINFYCRPSKADKKGFAPVEFEIRINGKRVLVQTTLRQTPEDFKVSMASKKGNPVKDYCDGIRWKLDEYEARLLKDGETITADRLKDYFKNGGTEKAYTVNDLFTEFLAYHKKRLDGGLMTKDTYNRYVKSTELFLQFNGDIKKDTRANNVEYIALSNMQVGVLSIYDKSTAQNYLQKIKACFKWGFECGKLKKNIGYLLKVEKKVYDEIKYLTQSEVQKIINHKFATKRLEKVADLFVFGCYSGLAIGDVYGLVPDDFQKQGDYLIIDKHRKKTGVRFRSLLIGESERIAKKYNFDFTCMGSEQKTNEYLKEIATICEILDERGEPKKLTYHMSRHTYATFLINHRPAIDKETIKSVMGWVKDELYYHYAKLMTETIVEDMKQVHEEMKVEEPVQKGKHSEALGGFLDGKVDIPDWAL